jgi:hypothetical protein
MGEPLVPPGSATQAVQPQQDARWRFERQRDRQAARQRPVRIRQSGDSVSAINDLGHVLGRRIDTTA